MNFQVDSRELSPRPEESLKPERPLWLLGWQRKKMYSCHKQSINPVRYGMKPGKGGREAVKRAKDFQSRSLKNVSTHLKSR